MRAREVVGGGEGDGGNKGKEVWAESSGELNLHQVTVNLKINR